MPDDHSTFQDIALRAVGRTVVNFQRLEHNLKLAARIGPFEGIQSKVQRDIEKRAERSSSFTLGQAVRAWLGAVESDVPRASHTPDLFEPSMRMTFSLGDDPEANSARQETLLALLKVRNDLIHGGLVTFDWDSRDECERLATRLNDVNDQIRSQIDFLAAFIKGLQGIKAEDVQLAETGSPGGWVLVSKLKIDA
jgi:hypothetical protein